ERLSEQPEPPLRPGPARRGRQELQSDVICPDGGAGHTELLGFPGVAVGRGETSREPLDDPGALPDRIRQAENGKQSRCRRRQLERLRYVNDELARLRRRVSPPAAERDVVQHLQGANVVAATAELLGHVDQSRDLRRAGPARLELLEVPE